LRTKFPSEPRVIETICVLGSPPTPHDTDHAEENIRLLREVGARYITYDELIQDTRASYEEYLAKQKEVSELLEMINRLDDDFGTAASLPGTGENVA
jgi:hypothetical protein